MRKKKKTINIKETLIKIFLFIILLGVGAVVGYKSAQVGIFSQSSILDLVLILSVILVSFSVQIIVHEGGHLICGLLSGYEFVSFRVGSLTFIKEDGKFAIKKFNIRGTGGQCLMQPKAKDYEECPYILYNLGGILMNAIVSILCFIIYVVGDANRYLDLILISMIGSGICTFIVNGIPMKISGVANDGYNLLSMKKDKFMRYCFYTQLRVNGLMSKGIRIKDMPLLWFEIDKKSDFSNPLVTAVKCMEANYYHDKLEFDKAKECYEFLLDYDPKIIKLYEYEIKCELVFYEIMENKDEEEIKKLYTKQLRSYVKSSKCQISKIRLMYAYALMVEKDMDKVKKILDDIEKVKKTYPNKGEIESELAIIRFIDSNNVV